MQTAPEDKSLYITRSSEMPKLRWGNEAGSQTWLVVSSRSPKFHNAFSEPQTY